MVDAQHKRDQEEADRLEKELERARRGDGRFKHARALKAAAAAAASGNLSHADESAMAAALAAEGGDDGEVDGGDARPGTPAAAGLKEKRKLLPPLKPEDYLAYKHSQDALRRYGCAFVMQCCKAAAIKDGMVALDSLCEINSGVFIILSCPKHVMRSSPHTADLICGSDVVS